MDESLLHLGRMKAYEIVLTSLLKWGTSLTGIRFQNGQPNQLRMCPHWRCLFIFTIFAKCTWFAASHKTSEDVADPVFLGSRYLLQAIARCSLAALTFAKRGSKVYRFGKWNGPEERAVLVSQNFSKKWIGWVNDIQKTKKKALKMQKTNGKKGKLGTF